MHKSFDVCTRTLQFSPFLRKQSHFVNQGLYQPNWTLRAKMQLINAWRFGDGWLQHGYAHLRSIDRRRIGFQLLGRPRVHGYDDGRRARQLDTPIAAAGCHGIMTPTNGFLNAQKYSTIRTCDIRQIALRLQLQRQRRVSLSGPPPSKSA